MAAFRKESANFFAASASHLTSVQLVGVYLVFATLIVPSLGARHHPPRRRLPIAYGIAVAGYALSFSSPSAIQTALALRQAIWRKGRPGWQVCGIPGILYSDHGSDFTSATSNWWPPT